MFNEEIKNQEEDKLVAEVVTEDVTVNQELDALKFSAGVEITAEELEGMDPILKDKLLKLKNGDVAFAKGINDKAAEINNLKHDLAEAKKVTEAPKAKPAAPTPAPMADEEAVVRQHTLKTITLENFSAARVTAKEKYGEQVISMIEIKFRDTFNTLVNTGKYDTNFGYIFDKAFTEIVTTDNEMLKAFNLFKSGKSEEAIKEEAKQQAALDILNSKKTNTTGLPDGGERFTNPPAPVVKPTGMKAANAEFKRRIKELAEQK